MLGGLGLLARKNSVLSRSSNVHVVERCPRPQKSEGMSWDDGI